MIKGLQLISNSHRVGLRLVQQFAKKKNVYSDQVELSSEEIDAILKKPAVVPKQEPVEQKITIEPAYYNIKIDDIVDQLVQQDPIYQRQRQQEHDKEEQQQQAKAKAEQSQQEIQHKQEPDKKVSESKRYKYDLPIPNTDYEIVGPDFGTAVQRPPTTTPTLNLFELLQLNKDSSYQEYEAKITQYVKHEEMYGVKLLTADEERNELREFMKEFSVPVSALKDEKYMEQKRKCWALNLSMPGAIENEHPHRFLKLRPVEEFRHTPLIPISERQMKDFNEMLEVYHRKGFFFEVKKEQIYQGVFVVAVIFIMIKMFQVALRMEEESGLAFQRLKLRRMGVIQDM